MSRLRSARSPKWTFAKRLEHLEDRVVPATAFALAGNSLIAFDTANPTAALAPVAVTGLAAGDNLVGIDFRPQNGQLYGLGFNSTNGTVQLYALSQRTGLATAVGTTGKFVDAAAMTVAITGTNFGFDFNPTVDRIRIVNDAGQNFRMNPNTGAFVDGDLGGAKDSVAGLNMDGAINGPVTSADAAAYTNNAPNVTATTLYTLSAASDALYIQNPPNAGTQANTVGITLDSKAFNFAAANGFDIPAGVNVSTANAVATGSGLALLTSTAGQTGLFSIDLTSGAATAIGALGDGKAAVTGFAIQNATTSPAAIGLDDTGKNLIRGASGTATVTVAITGVDAGETLVGIDYRPATGELIGLGVNAGADTATLYRLDPQTAVGTAIGTVGGIAFVQADGKTKVDLPAASAGYGFDFNPTVDRIRVVTGSGLNFRLNPITGAAVDGDLGGAKDSVAGVNTDGNINGLPAGSTGVTAAAYTNSFGQAAGGVTTLYTLDAASDKLFIQNPPNAGTQSQAVGVTLNGTALDFTAVNGFDIPSSIRVVASNAVAAGNGIASLTVAGTTAVYAINLTTGAATKLADTTSNLSGFALGDAPVGTVGFATASVRVSERNGNLVITLTRTDGTVGAFDVALSVTGGTATGGTDFGPVPATVSFADGQMTATVTIPLTADTTLEPPETLQLTLSAPTNGAVLGTTTTVVTITDASVDPLPQFAVGQDTGGGNVRLLNADQTEIYNVTPFADFTGGVRTAVADVDGDGVADLIVGTGPGTANQVQVISGKDKTSVLFTINPFEASFTGGVFIAGGDITGDGKAEIFITADQGGGARVLVISGADGKTAIADFLGIADTSGVVDADFRGGARVGLGDITGDGVLDVFVAAGFGGGPRITIWDGRGVAAAAGGTPTINPVANFFAFEDTLRNGTFVTAGDVTGDGKADLIVGGGPGGAPRVRIADGAQILANANFGSLDSLLSAQVANFFDGDSNLRGGIRVAVKDLDGDSLADVVTGAGEGTGSAVMGYLGSQLKTGTATASFTQNAFADFAGGVFVG